MATNVQGNRRALERTMEAIITQSKRKSVQPQLTGMKKSPAMVGGSISSHDALPERIADLVLDIPARRRLEDLVLSDSIVADVKEFLYEYSHTALLRSHSIEPRHTVLLVGPPGNGKTSLAEVFATELSLPLLSIRYDALIDSYLGETSNRLRKLIDHATLNPCVLFFDEFDAVGKERSDAQETGEIKRVVSSLLVQMDRLPSHTLVICATNHPELLDRAVWRRFELKMDINLPDKRQLMTWFTRFDQSLGKGKAGITATQFAEYMAGENMAEVEAFTLNVRRKIILSKGLLSPAEAVQMVLARLKKRITKIISSTSGNHGDQLSDSPAKTRSKPRQKNQRAKAVLP